MKIRPAEERDVQGMAAIRAREWQDEAYWVDRIGGYLKGQHHPQQALAPRAAWVALEGERVVGIVDESDLLMHLHADPARLTDPVATAMSSQLETIAPNAPITDLLPVFQRGHVAIVADQGRLVGLITRVDLISYLRKQLS